MALSNPFTHDPCIYNEAKVLVKAGRKVREDKENMFVKA